MSGRGDAFTPPDCEWRNNYHRDVSTLCLPDSDDLICLPQHDEAEDLRRVIYPLWFAQWLPYLKEQTNTGAQTP